jgi:hypothetical protein
MGNPNLVSKDLTISATSEVWRKLERFFALLHFNAGHTAIFGMTFDGDGADGFKIDPPPSEALRKPAQRIGDAGPTLEMATTNSYVSKHVQPLPFWTIRGTESEMLKVEDHDGPDSRRVVRRYDDAIRCNPERHDG